MSARPCEPERRRLLARVHAAKTAAGLDDETYRDTLERLTGLRSAAALNDAQLVVVAGALSGVKADAGPRVRHAAAPHQGLAKALWIALWNLGALSDGRDAALDAFIARQTKERCVKLEWLRAGDAVAVVEALKDWCAREGFLVPPAAEGRRTLVRAQWAKLGVLGALQVPGPFGLNGWLSAAVPGACRALEQFSDAELDAASKKLGAWIRRVQARRAKDNKAG